MRLFLKTKDFSISKESFELFYDDELEMLVTNPRPENLAPYYVSEDYISHTDSNTTFIDGLYQRIKRYTLNKKVKLIKSNTGDSRKLLDIGAGTGDFLVFAQANGFEIEGVEPNEVARQKAKEKGIALKDEIIALKEAQFDVITLWHVLEHLPDLETQIKNINALLDNNGTAVVAVPNFKSFDAKHYGSYWAAYDVPRHLWHFSRKSIIKIFAKEGMKVVSVKPMLFDSFYVSLLSEKYKGNPFYLLSAFLVGLWSNLSAFFTKEYSSHIYLIKKR